MSLTHDRNTPYRSRDFITLPIEANTTIFAGSLVAVNAAGNAVPGSTATTIKAVGRSEQYVVNNPGAAGAQTVTVRRGVFKFANDSADPVAVANLLANCYITDDQTVAATSATNTKSVAGKVIEVDSDGVWVEIY
ncbi:MAG: hypothetical protein P4N59_10755 [Negativicutes bacterium]|nr:hypothetical protein [Negativicutes bacterium]